MTSTSRSLSTPAMTSTGRSRQVAQGGAMFSSARAPVSRETQELLKVMMAESKLTNFQQRQLKDTVRSGSSLPLRCHPTTSGPGRGPPRKTPKKVKQPSQQGLRTKQMIDSMADTESDYRPSPSRYNSSVEKQKLQSVMAFGTDAEPRPVQRVPVVEPEEEEADRFDEILQEIEERREFLDEMEALGQGQKYRTMITTEISQKIHELEQLDKQRCRELSLLLKT